MNNVAYNNTTDINIDYQVKDVLSIFSEARGVLVVENSDKNLTFIFKSHSGEELIDSINTSNLDIKQIRHNSKKCLYFMLSKYYKYESPWGIMTGIRPTKLVFELMKTGGEEHVKNVLKNEYLVSEAKISLAISVAKSEFKVINSNAANDVSLYISIPYCPTICSYCSFSSYPIDSKQAHPQEYITALLNHVEEIYSIIKSEKKVIKTIYVGGGTPTSLNSELIKRLLSNLFEIIDASQVDEFTFEAGRPDTITLEKLNILKAFGVTRISINPQTMCENTLLEIGRKHSIDQIYEAFSLARNTGFENINMDLIAGLPNEDLNDFKYTLQQIEKINPESVTIHALAIKRAAKLKKDVKFVNEQAQHNEMLEKMFEYASFWANKLGMLPYYMYRQKNTTGNLENVGYCKKDFECKYNIQTIEEKQSIYAVGAGAVSKIYFPEQDRLERVFNLKDPKLYINSYFQKKEKKG